MRIYRKIDSTESEKTLVELLTGEQSVLVSLPGTTEVPDRDYWFGINIASRDERQFGILGERFYEIDTEKKRLFRWGGGYPFREVDKVSSDNSRYIFEGTMEEAVQAFVEARYTVYERKRKMEDDISF